MRAIFTLMAFFLLFATISCQHQRENSGNNGKPITKQHLKTVISNEPNFSTEAAVTLSSEEEKEIFPVPHHSASVIKDEEVSPRQKNHSIMNSLLNLLPARHQVLLLPDEKLKNLPGHFNSNTLSVSTISAERRVWLQFENDIFSNTDRYYTNGIVFGFSTPGLSTLPISRLMPNAPHNGDISSSLSLHQSMYTPLTTKTPPVLQNDRPYASTLYLNYAQTAQNSEATYKLISSIKIGVIGSAALGQLIQQSVHHTLPGNDTPLGWETQISNDLVLDYSLDYSRRILNTPGFELHAGSSVSLGTLYTKAVIHVDARAGTQNNSGKKQLQNNPGSGNWNYGTRSGVSMQAVGYDATLQGGLFNRDNLFTLTSAEVQRLVPAAYLGLYAGYNKFQLSLTQHFLGREFEQGRPHFWGSIGLQYNY